ncbi:MAG: hypothetical protein ACT4P9_05585 [Betaproteobacteria bacterium]
MEQLFRTALLVATSLALTACGGINVKLWPFGEDQATERSRVPANATAYQCDGDRKLYVRMLDNGAAAWVILPEREIRLERTGAAAATNYAYRGTLLEIKGTEAVLLEGSKPVLTGCKVAKS